MCCGLSKTGRTVNRPDDGALGSNTRALLAGASTRYTVKTATGAATGREFTSLVRAQSFATSIGGSVEPVG